MSSAPDFNSLAQLLYQYITFNLLHCPKDDRYPQVSERKSTILKSERWEIMFFISEFIPMR